MLFLLPTNMMLPFCHKGKNSFLPKNILKDGISRIIEKDDFILVNMIFILMKKLKMMKKFTFIKSSKDSQYFYENFYNFHILFSNEKTRKINI